MAEKDRSLAKEDRTLLDRYFHTLLYLYPAKDRYNHGEEHLLTYNEVIRNFPDQKVGIVIAASMGIIKFGLVLRRHELSDRIHGLEIKTEKCSRELIRTIF